MAGSRIPTVEDVLKKASSRSLSKPVSVPKMKKAKGVSFARLDWDVQLPKTWKALNHGKGDEDIVQVGTISQVKDGPNRFYDGNAKSWAPDIHDGIEPSTLVSVIDYNGKDKTLTVTFRNGFKATYHDISPEMVEEFSKADSKGRWALANLWKRSYS